MSHVAASHLERREFLRRCAVAAASTAVVPAFAAAAEPQKPTRSPNEKLNLGVIGVAARGGANLGGVLSENIVALCDIDASRLGAAAEKLPKAEKYVDYRKLLDRKDLDAVVVSTPDHTHFHPAWWALERGKHIYLEKPLAHEVEEVRRLTDKAREKKLATQLGSQRHAMSGLRDGVEIVKSGRLGTITEVHSWISSKRGMPADLGEVKAPPAGLDWDLWLGPNAERPYTDKVAPYRLAMGACLPQLGRLAPFWRPLLVPALVAAAGSGVVVDMRSAPYVAAAPAPADLAHRWVHVRVPGTSHGARAAKAERGRRTRWRDLSLIHI